MRKEFAKPNFTATMMAAVPYRDMEKAGQVILENFPEAPCLPVMTRSMRWLLEGLPCLVIDREKRQIHMAPPEEREEELLKFYSKYEQGDLEYFASTPQTAPFFYSMLERLKKDRPRELKWVIFHTAGPVLIGDMLKQVNGHPAIQHETLRDVIIKAMNMKARWLEKKIKEAIPEVEVIADLPETTLVSFTSAGGTGTREEIINAINESFAELTCLTWIHCCANIDWTLLTDSKVHVINFDAYQHTENVALFAKEIQMFLEDGGMIGWGIVPVIENLLLKENVKSLVEKLQKGIDHFVSKGIEEELLVSSSWVLPSCETVLLTPEQSDLVFSMTKEISREMKKKYGFEK
ncbi:MAG: hypothetical protein HF978_10290 [Desulfobacteraceae bacterium]|nr:hypothetical protein [Desulfobacteraceae bacterium]MBC2755925.1 hypothetical protein [Desulfobacteraceae bacterium]